MKHSVGGYAYNSTLARILVEYASAVSFSLDHIYATTLFALLRILKLVSPTKLFIVLARAVLWWKYPYACLSKNSVYDLACLNEFQVYTSDLTSLLTWTCPRCEGHTKVHPMRRILYWAAHTASRNFP